MQYDTAVSTIGRGFSLVSLAARARFDVNRYKEQARQVHIHSEFPIALVAKLLSPTRSITVWDLPASPRKTRRKPPMDPSAIPASLCTNGFSMPAAIAIPAVKIAWAGDQAATTVPGTQAKLVRKQN
eukprot:gnl/MRDRNA2_/MRDRNA2_391109_c0_seq1.p2 gnl/MRDRNA2_/MRDRNA2_391109_c0~~gnl/MRDRNA2_/MRDRNA2_391109_c0_seq1.p2  ORF type:complete len:127 (-),score=16.11 gnl/MRDRNA2_/MRDRNA2_391109_c0_seq1:37-417(-)